jgi:hypothetical protein
MFHYFFSDGCFRLFGKRGSLLEVANHWGLGLYIEFPSDWHEDGMGKIMINLGWPIIFISFPWFKVYEDDGQCSGPQFGFSYFPDHHDLMIYYGNSNSRDQKIKFLPMPWSWSHAKCVHEVRNAEGKWTPFIGSWEKDKGKDERVESTHSYVYTLKSGVVQDRTATIFRERRIWTRNTWFPRQMIRECIDIEFSDEVGERTGSWKGGTVGCSYEVLPGETDLECLRRMEKERKF